MRVIGLPLVVFSSYQGGRGDNRNRAIGPMSSRSIHNSPFRDATEYGDERANGSWTGTFVHSPPGKITSRPEPGARSENPPAAVACGERIFVDTDPTTVQVELQEGRVTTDVGFQFAALQNRRDTDNTVLEAERGGE